MKEWIITRYVKEEYWVEAETREDALNFNGDAGNPYSCTITKITCIPRGSVE